MLRKVSILVFGLIVASLFFRCSDDFDKNDNGVMFGKKSHRQVHYLSGDKTQEVLKKFEIAASKSKKMKLFTRRGASQRSNVGTIDYSTIMQVIDSLGNINYTFKVINHPEDDENTFHNLVLKELGEEEFKILLIKYQHFDANYKFNENTTFKSVNLTSTEPCNNEPIPISGGGGGGGTYDPGIPNPGSGGSSGSGTYNPSDSPSCWETLYIRCCHNTEYHYGNNSSCTCPEGERGATIIYNTCDTTRPPTFIIGRNTNIDPCNPDGEVGVLVPFKRPPCEVLKDLMDQNKYNARPYLDSLKAMVNTAQVEFSYSFQRILDDNGNDLYPQPVLVQGSTTDVSISLGTSVHGSAHIHQKGLYSTFSFGDLVVLLGLSDGRYLPNPAGNTNHYEVVFFLVSYNDQNPSNPHVKALMINDVNKLRNKINQYLNNPIYNSQNLSQMDKIDLISKKLYLEYENNEAAFLNQFKDFGVDLYDGSQINTNGDILWRKASLNGVNENSFVSYLLTGHCN